MWIDFTESYQFEKALSDYSNLAFRVGRNIIPKSEEPRTFLRTSEAVKKYNSKIGKRKFETIMNESFRKFKIENEY